MKTVIKRIFSCLMTILLTISLLLTLTYVLERKNSKTKYSDFFNEKNDFDVLFLGSSHVINGISPMDIWNEYGITSYNLGSHSGTIPISYSVLLNTLDYTKPKVVVLDSYLTNFPYKVSADNYSSIHTSFDAFPLSYTKFKTVYDLLDDPIIEEDIKNGKVITNEQRSPIGLLWNYSVYHTRWTVFSRKDISYPTTNNKGAEDRATLHKQEKDDSKGLLNTEGYGYEYINKIIEECNNRDIKLIMTFLPSRSGFNTLANTISKIADTNNVDYLDLINTDLIDYEVDFADQSGHLNPSGAKKVSSYIGKYISDKYNIENKKNNNDYSRWNDDYDRYLEYYVNMLKKREKIDQYLMLLNDRTLSSQINISNEYYTEYKQLIDNIFSLSKCVVNIDENADIHIKVMIDNKVVDEIRYQDNKIVR